MADSDAVAPAAAAVGGGGSGRSERTQGDAAAAAVGGYVPTDGRSGWKEGFCGPRVGKGRCWMDEWRLGGEGPKPWNRLND